MSTNSNGLPRPTPFDELTLQNDFLFQKVMQNKRICKRLIESILNVRIADISLIFICPFDLFHEGLYIYTFRKLCLENKSLELDDKATAIFLNAAGRHGDITDNALSFLRYVKSHRATDEFTREIAAEVNRLKEDQETRREYMQYAIKLYDLQNDAFDKGLERGLKRGRQEGLSQGLRAGLEQGLLNVAVNMKKTGQYSDEAIALATQLTLEQVKRPSRKLCKPPLRSKIDAVDGGNERWQRKNVVRKKRRGEQRSANCWRWLM